MARSAKSTPRSRQIALVANGAKASKAPRAGKSPGGKLLSPTGAINTSGAKTVGASSAGGRQMPAGKGNTIAKPKAMRRTSGGSASGVQGAK